MKSNDLQPSTLCERCGRWCDAKSRFCLICGAALAILKEMEQETTATLPSSPTWTPPPLPSIVEARTDSHAPRPLPAAPGWAPPPPPLVSSPAKLKSPILPSVTVPPASTPQPLLPPIRDPATRSHWWLGKLASGTAGFGAIIIVVMVAYGLLQPNSTSATQGQSTDGATQSPDDPAAAADRLKLYELLSDDYRLDGTLVQHAKMDAGPGLKQLLNSSARPVREIAAASLQWMSLMPDPKAVMQKLSDNAKVFMAESLTETNDEVMEKKENEAYDKDQAIVQNMYQAIGEALESGTRAYGSLMQGAQRIKRNELSSEAFDVSYRFDSEGSNVSLRNGTGTNLQNCLICFNIKANPDKVAAEKEKEAPGAIASTRAARRMLISTSPDVSFQFFMAYSEAYWSFMGMEQGHFFFIPEWKGNTTVEFNIATQSQIPFVDSAQAVVLTDEGEIKNIELSTAQMGVPN